MSFHQKWHSDSLQVCQSKKTMEDSGHILRRNLEKVADEVITVKIFFFNREYKYNQMNTNLRQMIDDNSQIITHIDEEREEIKKIKFKVQEMRAVLPITIVS